MTDDGETLGQLNDEGDEVAGAREVASVEPECSAKLT